MTPGHEFDLKLSTEVMGQAASQPPRPYSTSIEAAFEIARKMGVTLIPIEGGQWFAFVGPGQGWSSPAEFIQFLGKGEFAQAGAAVTDSAAYSICMAAWRAVEKRSIAQKATLELVPALDQAQKGN